MKACLKQKLIANDTAINLHSIGTVGAEDDAAEDDAAGARTCDWRRLLLVATGIYVSNFRAAEERSGARAPWQV